ncbi:MULTISPECIES: helix-turn-helix domain-containing protein [Cytobacillus]|uniref:helix-turn-helix domain-containing protein n=1 Tax=Cytobacillus TaxID=2675230 RepID=UPI00203D0747|nr:MULTISPECIES: helix-turn-helix transcriptional regulator [Cytobacillus]MCM3394830.1 helix-turn-helix transcriptional regulator [Cytobacillus oceanisediminis]UQX56093.1 helix-turn-helix transcriptional regulator [Cytobacillus pseudoceanisediminis]
MVKRAKSELKKILDQRNISIRKLAEMTKDENGENGIKFETLRRLYNDNTRQYQRDTIGRVCEVLEIEISDLLTLEEVNNNDQDSK